MHFPWNSDVVVGSRSERQNDTTEIIFSKSAEIIEDPPWSGISTIIMRQQTGDQAPFHRVLHHHLGSGTILYNFGALVFGISVLSFWLSDPARVCITCNVRKNIVTSNVRKVFWFFFSHKAVLPQTKKYWRKHKYLNATTNKYQRRIVRAYI